MNFSRSCSYSKVAKEDPDEKKHRRAQFLIDRELLKADTISRRRSNAPRMVVSKLKIKVGSRLKRSRKTVSYTVSIARAKICVYKKVLEQIKLWKQGIIGKDTDVMMLAPLFSA
ncbi:uncharacterized protein A4U43_C07F37770 [Asparagus officinalis]|uniref:Uncharacterized protein n=1 Tax=Asparagus officinalis TaxID=4686 RepID=A0A5P1EIC4_ASPOF|nr:uncharacterized protein A4U43_C07F37770 [Asparagus officinalis]